MIIVAFILLALILSGFIFLFFVGPKMLLTPDRRQPEFYQKKFGFSDPSQLSLRRDDRFLVTDDGFKLSYWVLDDPACGKPKGAVIYLHGITDSKVSGLNYAKYLAGFCQIVYLIDLRRHGESEGNYCTYGYYEKHDVVKLIDRIAERHPGIGITLIGNSMGAAIAIQVAAIDSRVKGVMAIAPFYDLVTIALDHEFRKIGIKSKVLLKFVLSRAERLADFHAADVSPARDMPKIKSRVLIVHGDEDKTVKKEYSLKLAGMNPNARLLTIKNAGHNDVLERGGETFLKEMRDFLESP